MGRNVVKFKAKDDNYYDVKDVTARNLLPTKLDAVYETLTDQPVASFDDGADGLPLDALTVAIEPVQSGSGDPAPDNVRPIAGWTGANVTRAGKNLFNNDTSLIDEVKYINSSDDEITRYGYKLLLPPGTYTIKAERISGTGSRYIYGGVFTRGDTQNLPKVVDQQNLVAGNNTYTKTLTVSKNQMVMYYYGTAGASKSSTQSAFAEFNITMWVGETVGDYTPYVSNVYPITWQTEAGTVYGGELDVNTGVLTVDRVFFELLGKTFTKTSTGDGRFTFDPSANNMPNTAGADSFLICSHIRTVTSMSSTGQKARINGSKQIFFQTGDAEMDTPEKFNTWLTTQNTGGNPVTACYEIASPVEYTLSPTEVNTLLGKNQIFADTGNVSVTWPADTKMYIDNIFTELQALILAQ